MYDPPYERLSVWRWVRWIPGAVLLAAAAWAGIAWAKGDWMQCYGSEMREEHDSL